MSTPGFNAGVSLDKSTRVYRATRSGGSRHGEAQVVGQFGTRADAQHVKDVLG